MKTSFLASSLLLVLLCSAGAAEQKPLAAPSPKAKAPPKEQFKKPKFIDEPNKRPEEVVDRDTFVDGADSPPAPIIPILAQRPDPRREAQSRASLGVCYSGISADGSFTGATPAASLSTTATVQLCLEGRLNYRPARYPVGARLLLRHGTGKATLYTSTGAGPVVGNADLTDTQARAELGWYLWSKADGDSAYEVSLLSGGAYLSTTVPTMRLATFSPFTESRTVMAVPAGLAFRVSPSPNWFAEIAYRRFFWLSASGAGDVRASGVSHSQIELDAFRHIAAQWAVRLTASYDWRSLSWTATTPELVSEAHSSSRVGFAVAIVRVF